jgi:sugar lactone lactonase YvrE
LTPDGSTVFVTGSTDQGPTGHFATLAYSASTGVEKWVANYVGSPNPRQYGRGNAIAVSPDGSTVFVSGSSSCSGCADPSFNGYSTVAYDASNGIRLWAARYAADGGPYSIAVTPNGSTLFVNGQTEGGEASATVAYDASTGERLWVIPGDDAPVYWGGGLSVSPDSSTVFVAGTAQMSAGCYSESGGYHTAAFDVSDGSVQWSSSYQVGSDHVCGTATSLGMSPDGSTVFVTGYGGGGSVTYGSGTVAYDASTGARLWAEQDDNIRVLAGDTVVHLAASPDGSKVFVAGYDCAQYPCPDQPFATVAYDVGTGNRLWASRYDAGGRGYPNDLAVSPDGSTVFETGQETLPCFAPCTTSEIDAPLVAYDADTGNEQWAANYPDNNAWALAVSPDGSSVYLAGTFTASTSTSGAAAKRCASTCGYSIAGYNTSRGPGTFEDPDQALRYNGWRTFFAKTALGGAFRASQARGDTAAFRTPRVRSVGWLTHEGPNQGKAKISIDGHAKGVFDLYAPSAGPRRITFSGLAHRRHTVKVEVLGRKRAASRASWVGVDGFRVQAGSGITEESSAKIRYDAWTGVSKRAASGTTYRTSGSSTARMSLVFKGRAVKWITATGPAYGRAKVVIDGRAHLVDLYRGTRHWQVPVSFTGLSKGRHRITVRPLGAKSPASHSRKVVFDAFVVRS